MRSAIILAAGKGTRMKSDSPKVLHPIIDRPMLGYIVDGLKEAGASRIVVVAGYRADEVRKAFPDLEFAIQEPQLGSGHAAMQATALAGETGLTLVINGDGPCIQPDTLKKLYEAAEGKSLTLLSSVLEDGAHYGRIVRDANGGVTAIVEAKDCTPAQREIREVNAGMYCFDTQDLFEGLKKLTPDNAQNEYYITDLVKIFAQEGKSVDAIVIDDPDETAGINDPVELAAAWSWLQQKICERHMKNGVQICDPARTVIGKDVVIGRDVLIEPDVTILGSSIIGDGARILAGTRLENAVIGKRACIDACRGYNVTVPDDAQAGPFAVLKNE
ncbi:bifunctional N-acetylglucosamine-1-phosphate uridyltransferase/glucosamine-1-phosphate acetyltransferase [uncultured Faecalibaculum sp.]|uniref:bifunctional UDP-N-acetylglucosamine diphosphorylase/glucosamine-1-phosphate N-acetyltransferase GlmU n=1 Tax=uncultured Faecalibaculum sp. TaxID=1729681 RepID=UPI0026286BAD|nr:NTP transferase domain-containing protein [uncultured Faecalibaculum sp.]